MAEHRRFKVGVVGAACDDDAPLALFEFGKSLLKIVGRIAVGHKKDERTPVALLVLSRLFDFGIGALGDLFEDAS